MGKSRGKGKKQQPIVATREDLGSGEEEKVPARRRGRPLKIVKSETPEKEEAENFDDVDDAGTTDGILSDKNINTQSVMDSSKKRRASEIDGTVKEGSGDDVKVSPNDSVKPVGFRQNGSRRKNKPQRAAEVGVECR